MGNKKNKKADASRRKSVSKPDAVDGSLIFQSSIPLLREAYTKVMTRPEYWWIQDECIETIGKTLSERNYVVC